MLFKAYTALVNTMAFVAGVTLVWLMVSVILLGLASNGAYVCVHVFTCMRTRVSVSIYSG